MQTMPTTQAGLNVIISIAIEYNQKTECLKERHNFPHNTPVSERYTNETLGKESQGKLCSKHTTLAVASYYLV